MNIKVDVNMEEVLATLGYMPPALAGALKGRFADFIDHHKRTVIKYVGVNGFRAKRGAQRMVASRLFGYSSKVKEPTQINEVQGESFMAARPDVPALLPEAIQAFEDGKHVYSREPMAIPFSTGASASIVNGVFKFKEGASRRWHVPLKDLSFIKGKDGRTYIIDDRDSTVRRMRRGGVKEYPIVGVMGRRRYQPAVLGFGKGAEAIRERHMQRISRDADLAMTAAGRLALAEANAAARDARDAFKTVYLFARGNTALRARKYDSKRGALEAAKQAREAVLRERLGGKGRS